MPAPPSIPGSTSCCARAAQKNGRTGIERGEKGHLDASAAISDPALVSAGLRRATGAPCAAPYPALLARSENRRRHYRGDGEDVFGEVDPDNKKYYEDNRKTFLSRLNYKLEEWQARLEPLKKEPLLAFHDDWDYFANRFGLTHRRLHHGARRCATEARPHRRTDQADQGQEYPSSSSPRRTSRSGIPTCWRTRTGAKVVHLAGSVGMLPNTDDYIALFDASVNALVAANNEKK